MWLSSIVTFLKFYKHRLRYFRRKPPEKSGGFLLIDIKNLGYSRLHVFYGKERYNFNKNL